MPEKERSPPPQRAREQSLQKISWNGGDHLALQCHIKSNQLKHNGAFLPPCTGFYALWSWPLFGIAIALLEMLDTSTLTSSTLKITKYSNLCNFLLISLSANNLTKEKVYAVSFHFLFRTNAIANFLVRNSSKKQMKIFYPRVPGYQDTKVSFIFLGRYENKIICFWNFLTFTYDVIFPQEKIGPIITEQIACFKTKIL